MELRRRGRRGGVVRSAVGSAIFLNGTFWWVREGVVNARGEFSHFGHVKNVEQGQITWAIEPTRTYSKLLLQKIFDDTRVYSA
jgi:hypothetical protein